MKNIKQLILALLLLTKIFVGYSQNIDSIADGDVRNSDIEIILPNLEFNFIGYNMIYSEDKSYCMIYEVDDIFNKEIRYAIYDVNNRELLKKGRITNYDKKFNEAVRLFNKGNIIQFSNGFENKYYNLRQSKYVKNHFKFSTDSLVNKYNTFTYYIWVDNDVYYFVDRTILIKYYKKDKGVVFIISDIKSNKKITFELPKINIRDIYYLSVDTALSKIAISTKKSICIYDIKSKNKLWEIPNKSYNTVTLLNNSVVVYQKKENGILFGMIINTIKYYMQQTKINFIK